MSEFLEELFGEASDDEDVFGADDPTPTEGRYVSFDNVNEDSIVQVPTMQKRKKKKKKKKKGALVEEEHTSKKNIVYIEKPGKKKTPKQKKEKMKKNWPAAPKPVQFFLPVKTTNKIQFQPISPPNENIDLRIRNPAMATRPYSSLLVIHGGVGRDRKRHDDLIRVDLRESIWKNQLKFFEKHRKMIPPINHRHHIFFLSHYLLACMSANHVAYVLHGWDPFAKYESEDKEWRRKELIKRRFWKKCPISRHRSRFSGDNTPAKFPFLSGYSFISHRSEGIFVFGKTSDGQYNEHVFNVYPSASGRLKHSMERSSVDNFSFVSVGISSKKNPVPRTDAAICNSRKFVFVFGGISKDGEIMNDLWKFEFTGKNQTIKIRNLRWIRMEHYAGPYTPPTLFGAVMKLTREQMHDEHIMIFGGHHNKNRLEPERYMYRYHSRKWTAVSPFRNGHVQGMAEMCHVSKGVNESFLLGGVTTDYVNRNEENCVWEVQGWAGTDEDLEMFSWLEKQRKKKEYVDLKLITVVAKTKKKKEEEEVEGEDEDEDEVKKRELWVHKCVVYARCPYFRQLLKDEPDMDELEMFEFPHEIVASYIHFLYTGNVILKSPKCTLNRHSGKNNYDLVREIVREKSELLIDLSKRWGHEEKITKIVSYDKEIFDLRFSNILVEEMRGQFRALLDDPIILSAGGDPEIPQIPNFGDDDDEEEEGEEEEEKKKKKNFTDLRVFCTPPESDEYLFNCHKVFLTRSTFVDKCLHSGMIEELESKLIFNNLSVNGLRAILEYFYTDQIPIIDHKTAIEIHVFAGLFKLNRIADICRNVILKLIEDDNVIDLINIFDVYADAAIVDACIRFMMKDMEKFEEDYKHHPGLEQITLETRQKIMKIYIRQKSKKF